MFKERHCATASSGQESKVVNATQKELTCDHQWKVPESFTLEL